MLNSGIREIVTVQVDAQRRIAKLAETKKN